jgi:hypothetical protein
MLVDDWVEALAIGGPYPALVFSGFLPCADGEGIAAQGRSITDAV